jgi:MFS family permease
VALLTATVAMAAAIGAATVASVAYAERAALPSGVPLTVMAAGGVAGALLWGARAIRLSRRTQIVGGLLLYATITGAAAAAPLPVILPLLLIAGALMAPCDALQAQLCSDLAPAARATESFAWLNSANWIGFSAGTVFSGALIDSGGFAGGFAACAAVSTVAAAILLLRLPGGAVRAP